MNGMNKQTSPKLVTTIRFTESQRADFDAAAKQEGCDSVVQWMIKLAERRVTVLNDAIASGQYVTIGEAKVPLADINPEDLMRAAKAFTESQRDQKR
ncbi:hypothetical protein SH668x_001033 [Planctomicrobium sp. SH668]|uniref:hypothetical protein n=1 Tax=Planctomicrobium sp. SH668 TaxID=3448126 RepID=UPI003F5C64A4